MEQEKQLRTQLVKLIRGGQAFRPLPELLEGLTTEEAGKKVPELPYTIWQLLEHLRFAQHDILEFCQNSHYKEPNWPNDYWPAQATPPDAAALQKTQQAIQEDAEEMARLVQNPDNDLYEPIPHGQGQTLLREAMLVAEHSAYHTGQIVLVRRLLGHWDS